MADEQTTLKLDLDNKSFIEKAFEAKNSIQSLSDAKNLEGLLSGLGKLTLTFGIVAASVFAIKAAFDTVFAAEKINQTEKAFENLSGSVGMMGSALDEALVKSSGGFIANNDLLEAANKAMVQLGDSSGKMADIMTVARTQTKLFGGDLLQNFEALNSAIASGQTRQLRHLGIIIDQKQAYVDYARSLGTVVDGLSEHEKKQAILNAVLEKGAQTQKTMGSVGETATGEWKKLGATLSDIGDLFTKFIGNIIGPLAAAFLKSMNYMVDATKQLVAASIGTGMEQAQAHYKTLTEHIHNTELKLKSLGATEKDKADISDKHGQSIDRTQKALINYRAELAATGEEIKKLKDIEKEKAGERVITVDEQAAARKMKEAYKFEEELRKAKNATVAAEEANMTTMEEADRIHNEKKLALDVEFQGKTINLRSMYLMGEIATMEQLSQLEEASDNLKLAKKRTLDLQIEESHLKALENQLKNSQGFGNQMAIAAQVNAARSSDAWKKSGGLGSVAAKSMQTNMEKAFTSIGDGSKSASEAMKGFMLNSLGDIASAQGQFMMLDAFKTFPAVNAPELAAGGALMALGGFLHSQGSGGGGGAGAAAGGGGGADTSASVGGTGAAAQSDISGKVAETKAVTVQVSGHYFETEQTKTRLVEMIRESSDATDFNIKQIGQ